MKKILLLLILNSAFSIHNSFSQSPDWLWAKAMGGTNLDDGNSVVIDASGYVYTTGFFLTDTVDFDPGPGVFNLTGGGGFISKLDASGNFIWAKAIGGICKSIAIDPAGRGDVYTTGTFHGTADFDPGAGVFNLTSAALYDIFILKLDSSGNFVWAKAIGGIGNVFNDRNSIAIDPAGSGAVYTTGPFQGTADFDPGAGVFNLTSASTFALDIFISKLDSAGNFVWAKAMGGLGDDQGNSIAIDPAGSGDVYTTGSFQGTVDFDPGAGVFNLTVAGFPNVKDVFVSKLNSSGNFVWAKAMGGTEDDRGFSIAIDPAGSGALYTTGSFEGTADFDPGAGVFNLTPVGVQDRFISKLDGSGNFVWAKAMGGATGQQWGSSIAIDPTGNGAVYTTGAFSGTADFDPGAGTFNLTVGNQAIFISKLDSSGNFVWAKAVGGTNHDGGNSIAIDASGNVYVTGYFWSTPITFGTTNLTNAGDHDIFIAKLDSMTIITGNNEIGNFGKGVLVFPNLFTNTTTISFSLTQSEKVSLNIFDVNGRLIKTLADKIFEAGEHHIEFNAEKLDAGIYFLKMQAGAFLKTEKLIITN